MNLKRAVCVDECLVDVSLTPWASFLYRAAHWINKNTAILKNGQKKNLLLNKRNFLGPCIVYVLNEKGENVQKLRTTVLSLGLRVWPLTWAVGDPAQHALHLSGHVLPAAGASLHVRLQEVQALTELLVTCTCHLLRLLSNHQLLQLIFQNDHPGAGERQRTNDHHIQSEQTAVQFIV